MRRLRTPLSSNILIGIERITMVPCLVISKPRIFPTIDAMSNMADKCWDSTGSNGPSKDEKDRSAVSDKYEMASIFFEGSYSSVQSNGCKKIYASNWERGINLDGSRELIRKRKNITKK